MLIVGFFCFGASGFVALGWAGSGIKKALSPRQAGGSVPTAAARGGGPRGGRKGRANANRFHRLKAFSSRCTGACWRRSGVGFVACGSCARHWLLSGWFRFVRPHLVHRARPAAACFQSSKPSARNTSRPHNSACTILKPGSFIPGVPLPHPFRVLAGGLVRRPGRGAGTGSPAGGAAFRASLPCRCHRLAGGRHSILSRHSPCSTRNFSNNAI